MKNELKHLSEYQKILKSYKVSEDLTTALARVKLVLLSAPAGVGRNTIINKLVENGDFYFLISDTTRQPRFNNGVLEQNGSPYWFKSEEDVQTLSPYLFYRLTLRNG